MIVELFVSFFFTFQLPNVHDYRASKLKFSLGAPLI